MLGRAWLKEPKKPARTAQSVFGTAVTLVGDVDSDDPLRIDGLLEGDVRGTEVTVTRDACVRGAIHAETVRLDGAVEGRIEAATVVVGAEARLDGVLVCESLEIAAGARITAHCRAGRPDAAPLAALPPPSAAAADADPTPA